ncbi:uracil phosphoribosyltransferase [Nonlabens spongiae]|uniref:Uracil phosphoribosyltransferase n=1 Tax=Nonlabens spongiae TaxID=331648 RepID=A0A1W6MLA3_9FLAO|nr:uracil phosphoribosyltransferase [Nonlabens spongiae]ARN78375.1 uracil phosphoribosyltransferase [Nonlabens spongiae]
MKEVFEAIAWFHEEVLFVPFDALRELENDNWWLANTITWISIIILCVAVGYWMKQLRIFEQNGEEDKTQTAHSFLGKNQQ